jgi:hypothetical protein
VQNPRARRSLQQGDTRADHGALPGGHGGVYPRGVDPGLPQLAHFPYQEGGLNMHEAVQACSLIALYSLFRTEH